MLSAKQEIMTLIAIKELKSATLNEIQAKIKEKWNIEADTRNLVRYIDRWRKGKYISSNLVGNEWTYSLRDIPWLPEAQMIHILKPDVSDNEAKETLDNYKQELKDRKYGDDREPDIRDYEYFDITMEVIDRIAGGNVANGAEEPSDAQARVLLFPRQNGKPIIPRSWIVGWIRDNSRLINQTPSIKYSLATSPGEFLEEPTIEKMTVIGKKGPQTHETIGKGAKFAFTLGYPMHGTRLKTEQELRKLFTLAEIASIKGWGSYDKAFGGRAKLIEMKKRVIAD